MTISFEKNTVSVRVACIEQVAAEAKRFTLVPLIGMRLPPFTSGSHIVVHARVGDRVHKNAYSLTGHPKNTGSYEIVVRKATDSQGGSEHLYGAVEPGAVFEITRPANGLPLAGQAHKHLFIAGGVGVTPFLSQIAELREAEALYELHYAFRLAEDGILLGQLQKEHGSKVRLYVSSQGDRLQPSRILAHQAPGTHVYVCGPLALIEDVVDAALALDWPLHHVHWEQYIKLKRLNAPQPARQEPGRRVAVSG